MLRSALATEIPEALQGLDAVGFMCDGCQGESIGHVFLTVLGSSLYISDWWTSHREDPMVAVQLLLAVRTHARKLGYNEVLIHVQESDGTKDFWKRNSSLVAEIRKVSIQWHKQSPPSSEV